MDREDTRYLSVKLISIGTAERISADISQRPIPRTRRWRKRRWTPGGDLSKGSGVEIATIVLPRSRTQSLMQIHRNSGNLVRAVIAHVGERVVHARCYREGSAAHDVHQRRELPVVDQQRGETVGDP